MMWLSGTVSMVLVVLPPFACTFHGSFRRWTHAQCAGGMYRAGRRRSRCVIRKHTDATSSSLMLGLSPRTPLPPPPPAHSNTPRHTHCVVRLFIATFIGFHLQCTLQPSTNILRCEIVHRCELWIPPAMHSPPSPHTHTLRCETGLLLWLMSAFRCV